jgi:dephospho-CoA kinase
VAHQAKSRPLVVGLTGGVGCGKTVVAEEFARRGAVIISGDETGHDIVDHDRALQKQLAGEFGRDILQSRGIKRRLLARRAFADPEGRQRLNELVHPALIAELKTRIRTAQKRKSTPLIVVDAALIVEWKMKAPIDLLIAVWAARANRRRWLRRRGWSAAEIENRMRAQLPFAARQRAADVVLRNDGDLSALRRKAGRLWQKLTDAR